MPKQAIVQPSIEAVEIIETPIPTPEDKEVVIKVVVSGANPKDWKYPLWYIFPNIGFACLESVGDDIAGTVHSVGKNVYEFRPGDRVAAFHEAGTANGSFAEYAVAPDWTTFHVPHNVSFEEAATVPLAALTAAIALYVDMKLPVPYNLKQSPEGEKRVPILIYGASSAVGAFAAKFARLSKLSPIIGVAGQGSGFAKTLVDYVVDYRKGEDALVADVEEILAKEGLGSKVPNVFDAISENGSLEATLRFLDPNGGTVSTVLPPRLFAKDKENFKYPSGVIAINSAVPRVHSTHKDFGYLWSRYLGRLLEDGRLKAHPYEVIPGGLNGILTGLKKLKDGNASAVKYVYLIEDTNDVSTLGITGQRENRIESPSSHQLKDFPFLGSK
ncbi:GroES-like protein [Mytilinidion resinicola]|uniref:GroES-like protein n=1 Tax=Mytilinidion resinicola TaxID=574789 RepID=A0A6A6Z8Q4_9PEZI|nr:GroES-like protein [Mytilinidion resinicola]KAF2817113.1 GroES-like protein [Mytilinidion resinicola]